MAALFFGLIGAGTLWLFGGDIYRRLRILRLLDGRRKPLGIGDLNPELLGRWVKIQIRLPDSGAHSAPLSGRTCVWWELSLRNYSAGARYARGWYGLSRSADSLRLDGKDASSCLTLHLDAADLALAPSHVERVREPGDVNGRLREACEKHFRQNRYVYHPDGTLNARQVNFVEISLAPAAELLVIGILRPESEAGFAIYEGDLLLPEGVETRRRKLKLNLFLNCGAFVVAAAIAAALVF